MCRADGMTYTHAIGVRFAGLTDQSIHMKLGWRLGSEGLYRNRVSIEYVPVKS